MENMSESNTNQGVLSTEKKMSYIEFLSPLIVMIVLSFLVGLFFLSSHYGRNPEFLSADYFDEITVLVLFGLIASVIGVWGLITAQKYIKRYRWNLFSIFLILVSISYPISFFALAKYFGKILGAVLY